MSFAERLKMARKKSKMTQKDLADKLEITPAMIAQYETSKRKPKGDTLKKIASALDLGYGYAKNGEPYFYDFVDTVYRPEYAENEAFNKWQYKDALADTSDEDIQSTKIKRTPEIKRNREYKKNELDFLNEMDRLGSELNNTGKEKAVEQVKLLTKIPEYRKKSSPDQAPSDTDTKA